MLGVSTADGGPMTVYQCPKCELKFSWRTERDHHCREEHPISTTATKSHTPRRLRLP